MHVKSADGTLPKAGPPYLSKDSDSEFLCFLAGAILTSILQRWLILVSLPSVGNYWLLQLLFVHRR